VTGPDADQGVVPLTQLGQGEVYDPTQNLNNQMNQDRLDAAMERARLAQEGANSRNNLRLTEGPNGVRTSDAQRFGRIVTQQIGIYSKPHPGAVAGINEPALSPQQATLQATIDAATIYPEEAMRRYPNNTVIVAAAQRALRNKAAVRAAPVQAQGPAQPFGSVAVPGLPTGGAGGGPSAAAGGVRKPTGDEVALATGDPKYKAFLAKTGVDVSGIP
jgi:hypothetical protein